MQFDLTQQYLWWSNTEAGILTAVSNTPNWDVNNADWDNPGFNWTGTNDSTTALATAQGCSLTRRELAASDGVYTPRDKVWLLPYALLGGYEPKPRDIWTDTLTGTQWTILDIARAALGESVSHYICTSRNLVLENSLIDAINIEQCAITLDAAGAIVQTWPPAGGSLLYSQLACRVQLLTSEPKDDYGVRDQESTIKIILSRQISLDVMRTRVNFGGVYYDILKLENPARIEELPFLDVVLRP